jgi:hypothetical protein
MRQWNALSMAVSMLLVAFTVAAQAAMAHHPGHGSGDDGRIPGETDYRRIGESEFRFHPKAHAYTYKPAPESPPQWYHFDDFAAAEGASYDLPQLGDDVVCATSGHRIRVAYSSTSAPATPSTFEQEAIRSIVRRMNLKIFYESLRSSGHSVGKKMRVDCGASNQIQLHTFTSPSSDYPDVIAAAKTALGEPEGANAVKNLIFFDGAHPGGIVVGGIGRVMKDTLKSSSDSSSGNDNRIYTTSAVVYNPPLLGPLGYWDTHASLHELFHTMGSVLPGAPNSTTGLHCTDGIDVLCYKDAEGVSYSETRCPGSGYPNYGTPMSAPLDCAYDSYFDTLEESGEWLNTHWNAGGGENPFLVAANPPTCDPLSKSRIKIADMNGDGKADIFTFTDPPDSVGAAKVWRSEGSSYTALGQVNTGFGMAYQDRTADWDGDGDDDVFQFTENGRADGWRSNGTSYTQLSQIGNEFSLPCETRIADMNGDSRDDILRFASDGNGYAWLSTGTPTGYTYKGLVGTGFGSGYQVRSGDYDGDGDDDLFQFTDVGNGYLWRADGTTYTQLGFFASGFGSAAQVRISDRDADGDDDLFRFSDEGNGYYWRSNGNGTFTSLGQFTSGFGPSKRVRIADINGDSKADILWFLEEGNGYAWLGEGWTSLGKIGSGFGEP